MRRPRRDAESGSVLIEAVVAVAILAMTLAMGCRALGDSARRTGSAARSQLAMLEARSRLDEVGADIALAPGTSGGEDGPFVWRVEIAPSTLGAGRLLDVSVDVSQGARPAAVLHSLRLVPPPPSSSPGAST